MPVLAGTRQAMVGSALADLPTGIVALYECTDPAGPLTDRAGGHPGTLGASTAAPTLDGAKITFDGVNDVITTTLQLGTSGTLIAAIRPPSLPGATKIALGVLNGAASLGYLGMTSAGKARFALGSINLDSTATGYTAGAYTLHAGSWDTTTMDIFLNGVLDRSNASGGTPYTGGVYLGCGNNNGTAGSFASVNIAYVVVYARRLNAREHQQAYRSIRRVLAGRGITV